MFDFDAGALVPLAALAIPVVAIIGGITSAIVRGILRHRSWELLQRERIAAVERGIDPEKLGHLAIPETFNDGFTPSSPRMEAHRMRQNLTTGGLVTLFVGIALGIFLNSVSGDPHVWTIGLLPGAVGLALLISAALTKPIDDAPRMPPPNTH